MWNWGTEKPNADYISRSDAFVLSNIRYARRSRNGTFGLEAQIVRIHKGPPRAGLRPSGKPELFHSNHSGHTGSIFLNGRSRARVAHWGHQKTKQNNKRKRQDIEKRRDEREWMRVREDRSKTQPHQRMPVDLILCPSFSPVQSWRQTDVAWSETTMLRRYQR